MKIIIGLLFLFCCLIAYFMYKYIYKVNYSKFLTNNEYGIKSNKKEGNLILFYTTWCPHCKSTLELWNTIKKNNNYNKYSITFTEIDCDKDSTVANTYNIEEYPTIILIKNDKKYTYEANLSKVTLDLFINTIMNE